ncbi:hypothetical protein GA0061071_12025 [Kosakonia oryzendophytica]|uniref:Uncharacterized protein n=1 Tax=Kosakonia oryzendophytica TaxID=1005665 RepID=A0A1C4EAA6_9ENTR|nr:hypothetical protein GA0061071_12025 [Kosakonia oryzendophytica]
MEGKPSHPATAFDSAFRRTARFVKFPLPCGERARRENYSTTPLHSTARFAGCQVR